MCLKCINDYKGYRMDYVYGIGGFIIGVVIYNAISGNMWWFN